MKELTDGEKTIWFAVFIVEGAIIIICNILSLIIFVRKLRQCKPCLLLINQSFVDVLVGVDALFLSSHFASTEVVKKRIPIKGNECLSIMYTFTLVIWNFILQLSLASLALIALDRAFAVFKPFQHRVLRSRHYYYAILATWCLCALPASLVIILRCESFDFQNLVSFSIAFINLLSTLLILIIAYLSVYIKIKYFPVFQHNSQARSQMKLSLTLFFASVASMSTVIPSSGIQIYLLVNSSSDPLNDLQAIAPFLMFANSFVNFAIYAWRFPGFADELKKFFCCAPRRIMNNPPYPFK